MLPTLFQEFPAGFVKQYSFLCVVCFESLVYSTVHNTGGVLEMLSFLKKESTIERGTCTLREGDLFCLRETIFLKSGSLAISVILLVPQSERYKIDKNWPLVSSLWVKLLNLTADMFRCFCPSPFGAKKR